MTFNCVNVYHKAQYCLILMKYWYRTSLPNLQVRFQFPDLTQIPAFLISDPRLLQ